MRLCKSLVACSALLAAIANAAELKVPGDFATIQQAVSAASPGDSILIAPGTYTLGNPVVIQDKSLTLRAENPQSKPVLDGNGVQTLLVIQSTPAPGVTVDGLIFRDGRATQDFHGGCALVQGSVASVRNSEFRNCETNPNDAGTSGGGLKVSGGGQVLIESSLFDGNRSHSQGGGIHFIRASGEVRNSTFTNNIASGDPVSGGGGVKATFGDGPIVVRNSTFIGNEASFAGGAISAFGSDMDIIDNVMRLNGNGRFGGAIHLETLVERIDRPAGDRTFVVRGNLIEDNFILDVPGIDPRFDRVSGGGLHLNFGESGTGEFTASTIVVENNVIRNNTARDSRCAGTTGEDAGICANGGGIVFFNARPELQIVRDNKLSGNIADAYGAALFDKVELAFSNNTIANNRARKTQPALGCVNNNLDWSVSCRIDGNRIYGNAYEGREFGTGFLNDSGAINIRLNEAWIFNNAIYANRGTFATVFIRHEDGPDLFSRVEHNTFVDNQHDPDAFQFGIVRVLGAGAIRNNAFVGSNRAIRTNDFLGFATSRIDGNNMVEGAFAHVAQIDGTTYATAGSLNDSLTQASGNTSLPPGFVDRAANDFRLDDDSALINRVDCLPGILVDIDGVGRPQGERCDTGAYEWFLDETIFADRFEG